MKYKDHLDFHFVTPRRLCQPLLVSALLFCVLAVVAFVKQYYLLAVVATFVYITSNLYWRYPERNSICRKVDIFASVCLLVVGTKIAIDLKGYAQTFWFVCLFVQVMLYTANHFIYKRLVTDVDLILDKIFVDQKEIEKESFCKIKAYITICSSQETIGKEHGYPLDFFTYAFIPHATWPNTESREFAYKYGMIAHMVFVHIIPNLCGIICLILFG